MKSVGYFQIIIIAILLSVQGCINWDKKYNLPDPEWLPEDLIEIAGDSFRDLHNLIQGDSSVALAMGVMADHITCHFADYGMRDLSLEPRVTSFGNNSENEYYFIIDNQWNKTYRVIADVNFILQRLSEGMQFGEAGEDNKMMESFCWFACGVAHGYLGLIFDKAAIVEWDSDLLNLSLVSWQAMIEKSLEMLDKAIALSDINQFNIPVEWLGGQTMDSEGLSRLANSYAARILVYGSRINTQNEGVNWGKVLSYTQKGITEDFSPTLGAEYGWYDKYTTYARLSGWGKADLRISNIMDHDFPSKWPLDNVSWSTPDGLYPGFPQAGDLRLDSDFNSYTGSNFPIVPGYFNSQTRFKRFDDIFNDIGHLGDGPKPTFRAWELELLEAEALLRTGDQAGALAILNDPAGPRKVRGGLADVQPEDDILRYILDEKEIECYLTGAGVPFYDMRRTDRLQPATLLHFPVPYMQLELFELSVYTIEAIADGVNGSAGDWTGWDEEK